MIRKMTVVGMLLGALFAVAAVADEPAPQPSPAPLPPPIHLASCKGPLMGDNMDLQLDVYAKNADPRSTDQMRLTFINHFDNMTNETDVYQLVITDEIASKGTLQVNFDWLQDVPAVLTADLRSKTGKLSIQGDRPWSRDLICSAGR